MVKDINVQHKFRTSSDHRMTRAKITLNPFNTECILTGFESLKNYSYLWIQKKSQQISIPRSHDNIPDVFVNEKEKA